MALNTPTKGGADTPLAPAQTAEAAMAGLDVDALAAETARLQAAAPQPTMAAEIDAATEAVKAPDVGTVNVFTCVASPNDTFFIYAHAPELHKRDVGGRMVHKPGDPPAIAIKFNNQRFLTNSASLAALIRFSAAAWPAEYGSITSEVGRTRGIADQIKKLRDKAAAQMSISGLADANDKPLLDQAQRHMEGDNLRAAEQLIAAVDTIQQTRLENSHQQDAA